MTDCDSAELMILTEQLSRAHGQLLTGQSLWLNLGFKNSAAFRRAKARGVLGVKIFTIPNRRGSFATTRDVAAWLLQISDPDETAKKQIQTLLGGGTKCSS